VRAVTRGVGIVLVAMGVIELAVTVPFMFRGPDDDDLELGRAGHLIVGGLYSIGGLLLVAGGVFHLTTRGRVALRSVATVGIVIVAVALAFDASPILGLGALAVAMPVVGVAFARSRKRTA
jgi:hypothetical protein